MFLTPDAFLFLFQDNQQTTANRKMMLMMMLKTTVRQITLSMTVTWCWPVTNSATRRL